MVTSSPTGTFRIGTVISNAIGVIMGNPVLYLGSAAVLAGVPALLQGVVMSELTLPQILAGQTAAAESSGFMMFVVGLLTLIGSYLLQATLTRATIEDLGRRQADLGDCIRTALSVLLPSIGLAILVGLGVMVGMLFLIVPGVILLLRWSVALPVLVQEQIGVTGSMSRSAVLTKGYRWSILGLFVLLFIGVFIVQGIVGAIFAFLGTAIAAVLSAAVSTIFGALGATVVASAYVELRLAKEGTGVDDLAEIFA